MVFILRHWRPHVRRGLQPIIMIIILGKQHKLLILFKQNNNSLGGN